MGNPVEDVVTVRPLDRRSPHPARSVIECADSLLRRRQTGVDNYYLAVSLHISWEGGRVVKAPDLGYQSLVRKSAGSIPVPLIYFFHAHDQSCEGF